jgi:mannose-6-phosphate isomerase-like protein (cupin superfamily)
MLAEPPPPYQVFSGSHVHRIREALLEGARSTRTLSEAGNRSIAIGRLCGRDGRPELHVHSDRLFLISGGSGLMRLGGTITDGDEVSSGEFLGRSDAHYTGYETQSLSAGTIVSIERGTPYQLIASGQDLTFVVVRLP